MIDSPDLGNKSMEFFVDCFNDLTEDGKTDTESAIIGMMAAVCGLLITFGFRDKGENIFRKMADTIANNACMDG